MATATMGLRRRVPVNGSPVPSNQSPSGSTSSVSNKRSRSENNNSPSHGNLNSTHGSRDEPPTKKSRGTSTSGTKSSSGSSSAMTTASSSPAGGGSTAENGHSCKSRNGSSVSRSSAKTSSLADSLIAGDSNGGNVIGSNPWQSNASEQSVSYQPVTGLGIPGTGAGQPGGLCSPNLGMTTPIPYMSTSMATFVGNATNLGKNSSVSYLDISNMTSSSLGSTSTSPSSNALGKAYTCSTSAKASSALEPTGNVPLAFSGIATPTASGNPPVRGGQKNRSSGQNVHDPVGTLPRKFQNDGMFDAYQPWVIKTYGDLAKTKTITIKKYARILRTLRGEEVNSAENSKFRFWVKSKGFHIGQPEGYDAKPADRIVGRHAVTGPGLDPPLYVPTQLPHNKALNGAEGTVPPGRVYKKVAIVENFFDIIHAVHVDLEGRPGKHAGQKRTYRTITETYAFLPREAVTRFLLGCTECQRRPRTPSPSSLSNQSQSTSASAPTSLSTSSSSSISTPLSPTPSVASSVQSSPKYRDGAEGKNLYGYRHHRHQRGGSSSEKAEKEKEKEKGKEKEKEKEKEEKYNPLSITNLLKKEPSVASSYLSNTETSTESRRTPESDRASSRGSVSSKRKRMLPEGRRSTPSPPPGQPLTRPWSPGLDPKSTAIDYSLPITTSYLKHQQRLLLAEKKKKKKKEEEEVEEEEEEEPTEPEHERKFTTEVIDSLERERFSPAAGLIDTNLNLLATIQHLHCQVMLALNERLRPSPATVLPAPLVLPASPGILPNGMSIPSEVLSLPTGENSL